jgi:gluconokinase
MIILVMGVSGSGKSTVGKCLAEATGFRFVEADEYHSPANVEKMRSGKALTDDDRHAWLEALAEAVAEVQRSGQSAVLAWSALKRHYRDIVLAGCTKSRTIWLQGDFDLIADRLRKRTNHFMPASLLPSQFAALEAPDNAIVIDIALPLSELVAQICRQLYL